MTFIINGEDVELDVNPHEPLRIARNKAAVVSVTFFDGALHGVRCGWRERNVPDVLVLGTCDWCLMPCVFHKGDASAARGEPKICTDCVLARDDHADHQSHRDRDR